MFETTHLAVPSLGFVLDPEHEAHQPPKSRGGRRDRVRLLVSDGDAAPVHARVRRARRVPPRPATWSS